MRRSVALLSQIPAWSVEWTPRERNTQADVIANNAAKFKRDVDYSSRRYLRLRLHLRNGPGVVVAAGDFQKRHAGTARVRR